jgi:AraC-binding-like domain
MSVSSTPAEATPGSGIAMGGSAQLPRHPVFRTCDLDEAQQHMCGVFDRHGVTYLPRERHLDFRHRQAKLGSITVNSLQWGAGVMVNAPQLRDFYLLQFTLAGECELWHPTHHSVLPARSVAIVNPGTPFRKAWMPRARQLLLRIDSALVEREFRAWTGGDEDGGIEFDLPPIDDMAKVGTLARYVRMICDDLKSEASDLSRPLVANRVAAGLVSLLLASMPHNKTPSIEKAGKATARAARRAIYRGARARRHCARGSDRCRWRQHASVANGLPPIPRNDTHGVPAINPAGVGAGGAEQGGTTGRIGGHRR